MTAGEQLKRSLAILLLAVTCGGCAREPVTDDAPPDRSPSAAMGRSPSAAVTGVMERSSAGAQERPPASTLIPAARDVHFDRGVFTASSSTVVTHSPEGAAAARYFIDLLQRSSNMRLRLSYEAPEANVIRFEHAIQASTSLEAYSVSVTPEWIVVSAGDARGLFYGAVTAWQLLSVGQGDTRSIPAQRIDDAPRFRWRGLMLDSARHYQSPEFIKRFLDAMAVHKLNVLHWHLTDDQGWRLEIRKYPKLTEVGAWRVPAGQAPAHDIDLATGKPKLYGGFYTQAQVRDIVGYAAARHITIVPEIEMPGHASAPIAAYPQLGVDGHRIDEVPADWGVYPNLYDVTDETFAFLEDVLTEVLELFPSEYIHIGGDEATKEQWERSSTVQARMRALGIADEHHLQSYFVQRIEKFLSSKGRRLIGWDEILEGGLAPNATVMSWRGLDGAIAAATAGHATVLSPDATLYFDNRPFAARVPGRGRIVGLEDVYRFDPAPAQLTEDQRQHVLGVQANIWTEHIRTEDRVEYMTFPRAAALAEVAWSDPQRIDWNDFERRVPTLLARYRSLGLKFAEAPPASESTGVYASQDLALCSKNIALSLEDDAPLDGPRAAFLVDIMNPCWQLPGATLEQPTQLTARVGQVPFNFQIGADVHKIKLHQPSTAAGELEVRAGCEGDLLARLPLAPAVARYDVTTLPSVTLPSHPGTFDLCLRFTRSKLDPIWVLDTIELSPRAAE